MNRLIAFLERSKGLVIEGFASLSASVGMLVYR